MSTTPDRPEMDDDLERAYAQARALAGDGTGPSASVRANVLAAAREVAEAATRSGAPALAAVAAPVAAVGRGRGLAVNLSSWRVRSGAAFCAALLVALVTWRFDESHRGDAGVQVASAELKLAEAPVAPLPKELPVPALSAASTPYAAPPPVVEDPVDTPPRADAAAAKQAPRDRDRDVIVAQAEPSYRSLRAAPPSPARTEARLAPAPPAPPAPAPAAPPAPVAMPPEAPPAQAPTTVTITAAAAAPQLATLPPMLPSVVPRRVPVLPATPSLAAVAPASGLAAGDVAVASANDAPRRVELTGSAMRRVSGDAPTPALQSAADRGDVEALRTLLAEPAVRVDAPDAAGRTALLHAVLAQQVAAVRLLLAAGADPGHADRAGLTPRAAAQAGADAGIAGLLAAPH